MADGYTPPNASSRRYQRGLKLVEMAIPKLISLIRVKMPGVKYITFKEANPL